MMKLVLALLMTGAAVMAGEKGVQTYNLGNLKFTAFQDASSSMPISLFRGAEMSELQKLLPGGKAEASVNAFLLQVDGKCILVDSGNGGRRGSLLGKMTRTGIKPETVDTVLLTHMHGDHIGGLLDGDKAVFPKATIYVSEPEYNYWKGTTNALAQNVFKVYGDRIKTFKLNTVVLPGITGLSAIGHTPGHTVYELDSIMIIGDLLHAAALQFPRPDLCPTYDMDMPQAVKTRLEFYEKAARSGKLVAGMHLPFPGVGLITRNDSGSFVFKPAVQGGSMFDYGAFFKENPLGVLATLDDEQIKTHIFHYLFAKDDRVYFHTDAKNAAWLQLQKKPVASFCCFSKNYAKVVSVSGKVVFVDNLELKKEIIDASSTLKAIYHTPENPDFKLLYIDVASVDTSGFTDGPKTYRLK